MKYLTIILIVLMINTSCSNSDTKYPFIGKRYFNFMGGTGTEESIRINMDGTCIIIGYGCCGIKPTLIYEGEYRNPLMIYNTENGSDDKGEFETGYLIKGGKIYIIDENEEIIKDCKGDGKECESELYK